MMYFKSQEIYGSLHVIGLIFFSVMTGEQSTVCDRTYLILNVFIFSVLNIKVRQKKILGKNSFIVQANFSPIE